LPAPRCRGVRASRTHRIRCPACVRRQRRGRSVGRSFVHDSLPSPRLTACCNPQMGLGRSRCCAGKRPNSVSTFAIQGARRVRRATSCALRIAIQLGQRSFIRLDASTPSACCGRRQCFSRDTLRRMSYALRFRSYRDELSLTVDRAWPMQSESAGGIAENSTNRNRLCPPTGRAWSRRRGYRRLTGDT
jgi:hypothetical protein